MHIKKIHNQGSHLMIDAYEGDPVKLADVSYVKRFLEELPKLINMTVIMKPQMIDFKALDNPLEDGVSGFTMIAESHISIHTYPRKRYFAFDAFSCNEFDIKKVIEFMVEYFDVRELVPQTCVRGIDVRSTLPGKVQRFRNVQRIVEQQL